MTDTTRTLTPRQLNRLLFAMHVAPDPAAEPEAHDRMMAAWEAGMARLDEMLRAAYDELPPAGGAGGAGGSTGPTLPSRE